MLEREKQGDCNTPSLTSVFTQRVLLLKDEEVEQRGTHSHTHFSSLLCHAASYWGDHSVFNFVNTGTLTHIHTFPPNSLLHVLV